MIISTSEYPDSLRIARVVPIPKVKSPSTPGDFRPISVQSVLNEIVEKTLFSQLCACFERNDLLYQNQFGFRAGRSTSQAVVKTVERLREGLDRGKKCGCLLIDTKKAFDSVRKEVLIEKCALTVSKTTPSN